MWPVMTLTLLLQLTDDEQLYASELPCLQEQPVTTEQQAPPAPEAPAAAWPEQDQAQG